MRSSRFFSVLLFVLAGFAGAGVWLQRQAADALRAEIAVLREDNRALARERAENARLKAEATSASELARLRAQQIAATQLQAEIVARRRDVERREAALHGAGADQAGASAEAKRR